MTKETAIKQWYVYFLRCADDTIYTGITNDIERRVIQHNTCNKTGAKYTRTRRPVTLVYKDKCTDKSDAAKKEYKLKRLSRKAKLLLIAKSV